MNKKIVSLGVLLFSLQTWAWGPIGHRTVGLIADSTLNPTAKAQVQKLLGKESLADVANWADSLKSGGDYRQAVWYHFEKMPDHLSFVPHVKALPQWQQRKGGMITAILVAIDNLKNPKIPSKEKTDSLKFLVHFMGDLHQPFHSGRPDDNGGVKINVTWFGQPMSLHKIWDSGMMYTGHADFLNLRQPLPEASQAYYSFLAKQYARQPVSTEFNLEQWLNESISLRAAAYDPIYSSNQNLYQQLHMSEIDQRIYEAGIRLGYLLNSIYAGAPLPAVTEKFSLDISKVVGDLLQLISLRPEPVPALMNVHGSYPEQWWEPVEEEGAPGWEILPQEAGDGEVILSKRTELGIFSNFAATPFEYRGQHYASVEGFWQMMKYPEGPNDERLKDPTIKWPYTRSQVAQMTGFDAKNAGTKANEIMKKLGIVWVTFEGRKINYLENAKGDFYKLIWDAEMAKLNQNMEVERLLRRTGDLKLRPDHQQAPSSAPAWLYHQIWMDIRAQLD